MPSFDIKNPPTPAEVRQSYVDMMLDCYPQLDPSALDPGTPDGNLVDNLTSIRLAHIDDILYKINTSRGTAEGIDLDAFLLTSYGLRRKPRTNGTASITIYGEPGFIVPSGFEIVGTDTNPFRLLRDTKILHTGQVTTDFVETQFTTKQYLANTLTNIINNLNEVHRVTQPAVSTPGKQQETDYDFKLRAYLWGSLSNNSSFKSIMAWVANLPGVTKCNGYENKTNKTVTYQGTQFTAHSVGVVVLGGLDFDIATAISKSKPPGVPLVGDIEVPLVIETKELKYNFYRPTPVPLKFSIKVKLSHGYPNNYERVIKDALVAYIDSLPINRTIEYTQVVCVLNQLTSNFMYTEVKMSKKTQNLLSTDNIDLDFTQMASLDPDDITITKAG